MTILQEVLVWTQGIPAWQSDAVSRLLAKKALTPEDYEDLYALVKLAHGIPDPKNRQPKRGIRKYGILVMIAHDTGIGTDGDFERLAQSIGHMPPYNSMSTPGFAGESGVLSKQCRRSWAISSPR